MASNKETEYKIKIGKEIFEVDSSEISGAEILNLAGKSCDKSIIYQKTKGGGRNTISLDDVIDLTDPGIEKFVIIPVDQTEGYTERRDFELPNDDIEYLNSIELAWDTIFENNIRRLVIYNFPIPNGYKQSMANINIRIGTNYPDEQIDMAYFYTALERTDGRGIAAISADNFDGKSWQRWSRHRTTQNPWRPGEDDISTHLICINQWLIEEIKK